MTSYTDETVSNLIINKLTKAQYDAITTPSETELYIVTDEEVLPDQTGNSGKYLATNGTTASWETVTMPTIDQTYDGTSANVQSGVAIAGVLGDIETLLYNLNSGS